MYRMAERIAMRKRQGQNEDAANVRHRRRRRRRRRRGDAASTLETSRRR